MGAGAQALNKDEEGEKLRLEAWGGARGSELSCSLKSPAEHPKPRETGPQQRLQLTGPGEGHKFPGDSVGQKD